MAGIGSPTDRPLALKAVLALLGVVLFGLAALVLFQRAGVLVEPVMPTLGLAVAFGLTGAHSSRQQLLEKRAIRDTFGLFVAPAVVRQLEAEPERLRLGGESRELTYVFTDIAGFAGSVREDRPAEFVGLLNGYLDGITRVVLAHRGTIDKFIGDATVSLFAAPAATRPRRPRGRCALALDGFASALAERRGTRRRLRPHPHRRPHRPCGARRFRPAGLRFDYTAVGAR